MAEWEKDSKMLAFLGMLSLQAVRLSGLLCFFGCPMIGLLLVVIYIGGMLVVFLFSSVLCAEPYPEIQGLKVVVCFLGLFILISPLVTSWDPEILFGRLCFERLASEVGFEGLFVFHW